MSDEKHDSPTDQNDAQKESGTVAVARKVTGRTSFIASIPSLGMFIAAVVLAIGAFVSVCSSSLEFVMGEIALHELSIEYVEDADAFLLAIALFMLAVGLVNLFISDNIPLPKWLEFHDFDDLKERFTSVVVVMIGVHFLGQALKDSQGIDILWTGLGCAAVIIALTFFIGAVFKSEE